jgi:putative flippase GtrA
MMRIVRTLRAARFGAGRAIEHVSAQLSLGIWPLDEIALRRTVHEGFRFVAVGLANTALTFAIYLTLLWVMSYGWAFFFAFIGGLVFQTLMKIRVVFRSRITIGRVARYVVYSVTYFSFNFLLLRVFIEMSGVKPSYAPLFVLCLMTPVNFLASRLVIAPGWMKDDAGPR